MSPKHLLCELLNGIQVSVEDLNGYVFRGIDNEIKHNQPSGDSTPRNQNNELIGWLINSGKLLAIEVQDYMVIGRDSCQSIPELS